MPNRILATFGLLSLLTSASLCAQSYVLNADIPFGFHLGNSILPAGQYAVKPVTSATGAVLAIKCLDSRKSEMFLTDGVSDTKAPQKAVLQFVRYGNVYFLERIWTAEGVGRQLRTSKAELEMAKQSSRVQPAVVAVVMR